MAIAENRAEVFEPASGTFDGDFLVDLHPANKVDFRNGVGEIAFFFHTHTIPLNNTDARDFFKKISNELRLSLIGQK
jgi:hypothetical protein